MKIEQASCEPDVQMHLIEQHVVTVILQFRWNGLEYAADFKIDTWKSSGKIPATAIWFVSSVIKYAEVITAMQQYRRSLNN